MAAKKSSNNNNKSKSSSKTSSNKKQNTKTTTKNFYSPSLYNQLIDQTSIIFLYEPTVNLLKTNSKLQSTVEFYIDAIYTYETKSKIKDKKASDFKTAYDSITKKDLKLELIDKNEVDGIEDELNFLKVFVKNTINQDWNEVMDSFKKKESNTELAPITLSEEKVTKKEDQNTQNENYYKQNINQGNFNAEEFMRRNHVSMDDIADAAINQQATLMLQRDILNNNFYKYKTKPTWFLIFKWALFTMWILTAITLIINSFAFAGLHESTYLFLLKPIQLASAYPSPNAITEAVGNNGFFINGGGGVNSIFGYVLSLFFPVAIALYAFFQIKNYKNENAKFTCKTFITWLLLIWIIFVILSNDVTSFGQRLNISQINSAMDKNIANQVIAVTSGNSIINVYVDNQQVGSAILLSSISSIIYFTCIGLSVLLSVAIIITRPKVDVERMRAKVNEYANDIKSGKIQFDNSGLGGNGGFSGFNPFNPF